jgi:phage terminase Nu1 subunit (DNA packaging protein)
MALAAERKRLCKALARASSSPRRRGAVQGRARLGQAQAALVEAKAAQLRSELIETDAVEKLWTSKLRAFRNRILGIPGRVQYLSARQTVALQQELRAALDELANDKGV